jgi:hypothetical protein
MKNIVAIRKEIRNSIKTSRRNGSSEDYGIGVVMLSDEKLFIGTLLKTEISKKQK